ncbi:MAG: hypothetical protein IIV77_07875 [Bacteroidaceae bacterium]|nr:hypothetical protein [Bacteroidaceae bacterium]
MKKTKLLSVALLAAAWLTSGSAWAQHDGEHSYTNGICTIEGCTEKYQPATLVDGWYHLGNAGNVEWFGQQVTEGHHTIKGKLTDDIDYGNIVNAHKPIGGEDHKYIGQFDGQGHRIKNMIIKNPTLAKTKDGVGFFGSLRGGGDGYIIGSTTEKEVNLEVVIKNLIIDSSCSITSQVAMTGGIVGRVNNQTTGHLVTIENCINEADVTSTQKNVAGILGTVDGTNLNLTIKNCANLGKIDGATAVTTKENAAICGWTGKNNNTNVQLTGCWNIGEVVSIDGNGYNLFRVAGSSVKMENNYDLNPHANATQGLVNDWITTSPEESGELCYKLNGDQSVISWYQKLDEDEVPMPMAKEGAIVYQNATYLCPDKTSGDVEYSNANTSVIPPHEYVNGICSECGAFEEPSFVDGYYQLTNAGNVEWFSARVAAGNLTINGKLMKDIDFENVENIHSPIGPSTGQKFNGTFDGQGFRIKNMIINRPDQDNQGFFGYLRGNNKDTYVKNLIIDSSCSITGKKSVGGIAANGQNNETFIYIQNCVNEANITALGGDAGGILGSSSSNYPKWIIQNCVNTGTITATTDNPYAGGLTGWMGDNGASRIENFINIGTITYMDNNQNIYRGNNINNISALVDLSGTAGATQGIVEGMTPSDLATGKVAYYINNIAGSNVFFQTLEGADADAYPVPFSTSAIVYEVGDFYCDGTPKGAVAYSNTDASNRDAHITDAETGFCTVCDNLVETWIVPESDGFYHLSTANQVEWFSAMVAAGHGAMKVKLDADIDFGRIENAHTPIGTADKKFFGVFDGQKHRIKGMVLNKEQDGVGFFGHIQAGGTYNDVDYTETSFRNVIIDGSCSVTSTGARCGGLIGRLNGALNDDATLRIEYCGNEANVIAGGQNAGGLMGGIQGTTCKVVVRNCYNTGNIAAGTETTALVGWTGNATGENVVVERCWNSGLISNLDGMGRNLYRCPEAGITASCLCDLSETPNATQGQVIINTANPYASGELCYLLNGDQNVITWTQNLGEEEMPNMYGTTKQVYQAGTQDCSGAAVGVLNYNNESGKTVILDHVQGTNGFCSVCGLNLVETLSKDEDGFYLISNAAELEKFSDMVETGGQSADNKARLTADIDMAGVTHKPIGGGANDDNKFNSTFDGQNHTISNMVSFTRTENVGLFSWVRGSSIIKNLTIDGSCTIEGTEHVAAFVGKIQVGDNVRFENCINEATVRCSGNHAAAFVGKSFTPGLKANMINCGNAGRIEAGLNACALVSWNTGGTIKNCWNVGEIVKSDWDREHGADYDNSIMVSTLNLFNGNAANNVTLVNTFDASPSAERSQGTLLDATAATNGELAYKIGGDWKQLIRTDKHPVFDGPEVSYVGDAGYATMYDKANDWALNGDATAYIAAFDGKYLQLTEVEDVPAGAAVILKGSYYNKLATTATSNVTANELLGTDADTPADGTMYVLAQPEGEEVGFYQATGTIAAGKAYYQSTSGVKAFYFGNGDATSIQTIDNAQKTTEDAIYNIAGQRLNKVQKGINIINGKKVLY